ncbi:MAG: hypothetical protein ACHQ7N_02370 [Candidatus Methylomirabilales bacterium]
MICTRPARLAVTLGVPWMAPRLRGAVPLRTLVASVERIRDGDALVAISENGTKVRIRLLGIDASEIT